MYEQRILLSYTNLARQILETGSVPFTKPFATVNLIHIIHPLSFVMHSPACLLDSKCIFSFFLNKKGKE